MLTITTTHRPATDLGYLLHKNPARTNSVELTFGMAFVAFPEASEERCTAAVVLDIDSVQLVRGEGGSIRQYVNDRPYVASSFLSVALTKLFGTAMSGRCKEKPELVDQEIPLEFGFPVIRSHGEHAVRMLFEPLGFEVECERLPLDDRFPEWGESDYYRLVLRKRSTLRLALNQIYTLIPTLDPRKHYYLSDDEVSKLLRKGEGWLQNHPHRNFIVRTYLGRRQTLILSALDQLANAEPELDADSPETEDSQEGAEEKQTAEPSRKPSLHEQRHDRIVEWVRKLRSKSVVDLGCGEGRLMRKLVPIHGLDRIVGMDVAYGTLERAERTLRLENSTPKYRERIQLIHGSLLYRDARLEGFDCATVVEVIEHLDAPRLGAFEQVVFACAKPRHVLVTTPNREYNSVYQDMPGMRHEDHRFEWTRAEFREWCERVARTHGYEVEIESIGEEHPEFGGPSQLAVFRS